MLPDFIIEAQEHLEEMEGSLLRLEQHKSGDYREIMDEIFRSAHTIKGAAQFVGIDRIAELSHKLENLLDLIRKGEQPLTPAVTDLLIEGKDRITQLVEELERGQTEKSEVEDLLVRIRRIVDGDAAAEPEEETTDEAAPPESAAEEAQPKHGSLAEESMNEEHDEELYSIFLQQLKENIPFLYAQTVELSLSVDKQDVLYRCGDSIKSLKSSANYMGYEKLAKHYSDWQAEISKAIEQLSSGRMPDLAFMQEYIDEIIRSFPQAMEGYEQEEARSKEDAPLLRQDEAAVESDFDRFFDQSDDEDEEDEAAAPAEPLATDLDEALKSIFSEEDEEAELPASPSGTALEDEEEEDSPAAASYQAAELPELAHEMDGEEHDQELVSIFLKKLQTDIRFIKSQAEQLPAAADKQAVLQDCQDAVARLASSANYMEYQSLAAFCSAWRQALQEDAARLNTEEGAEQAVATLRRFAEEIIRVYPQAAENDGAEEKKKQPQAEKTASPAKAEEPPASPAPAETAVEKKGEAEEEALRPEPAAESEEAQEEEDDQELFSRLSSALDQNMSHTGTALPDDHVDSVIEQIMDKSEGKNAAAPMPPPSEADEGGELAEGAAALLSKPQPAPAEKKKKTPPAAVAAPPQEEKKKEKKQADVPQKPEAEEQAQADHAVPEPPAAAKEVRTDEELERQAGSKKPEEPLVHDALETEEEEDAETEEKQTASVAKKTSARSSIRVDADKIDYLMNQVGELVVSRAYFAQLVNEMRSLQQELMEKSRLSKGEMKPLHEFAFRLSEAGVHLGRVSNELQEGVMKIRMLPIEQLFKRYPRLVRDLTHRTDKDVRLITRGEETELDKMVIESMSDPLIHIIRNAVDHGIETTSERKQLGKPAQGSLILEAYHESDHIVLEITDDGRGIDPQRIRAKAAAKGLFTSEELGRMSDLEVLRIIMEPGFSTAEKATETSGRGVGMDVVKKNIERLNGMIEISSKPGKGTRMRIKIPLTMAIIQALMVRVGREKFTIPLTTVEETLRIFRHEISVIEGVDVIHIRDITMPIFRLDKIYHIKRSEEDEEKMFVVVVSTGTQEVGLVVDELLGQEEVVIKPLADYLRQESGFGGATILGDGGISLILDIPELVKLAADDQADRQEERAKTYQRKRRKRAAGAEAAQSQTAQ
jgi:two-component system chemotaxis sensor kinase CheA